MRVAFFHGLESKPVSEKNYALREFFDDVFDPAMDYRKPGIFMEVLQELKNNPVDLLIGSSMGGWFAYSYSTHFQTKTLLFNPAVHSRSVDPEVRLGNKMSNHILVLGEYDDVITPKETIDFFERFSNAQINIEQIGHPIPLDVFKKYLRLFKN